MATSGIIDLDEVLLKWAEDKLGQDRTVDRIDTSKVEVCQKSVVYTGGNDWWTNATLHEEYFDNDEDLPATWEYNHKVAYQSKASWSLVRAFKSAKFLPISIKLQYPSAAEGSSPLEVVFNSDNMTQLVKHSEKGQSDWTLTYPVTVQPYSSAHACAQVRLCRLVEVVFFTEIVMSGSIKIVSRKKKRKMNKNEMTVGIADVLDGKESLGFAVTDNTSNPNGPARLVTFKVEGRCSGEVAVEPVVQLKHISSLV